MFAASLGAAAATSDEPIITFHTTLYDLNGPSNVFTFYLGASETTYVDVDCGFGPSETEVEMAYYDPDQSGIQGTPITCTVSAEGEVKVYGDASKIDYIDLEGCYITSIDWPTLTNVEILCLNHNLFTSLDLSHMTKLQALYASDIPCTAQTPFIVGASKPDLQILDVSMVEWIDPDFNLTGYPKLRAFTAYSTHTLRNADTSKCPGLLQLSIDGTAVERVDVSNNPALLILNVSESRVRELDLSNNKYLTELYAQHDADLNSSYKLTSIDLSKNPEIQRLYLAGNSLRTLDLSANSKLVSFSCRSNLIEALNFDNMPNLTLVDVARNRMDFNTCPVPRTTFSDYLYDQDPMIVNRSYAEGTVLDFTSRVMRSDSKTDAVLYSVNANDPSQQTILSDDYWSFDNGKITLKKACTDSVFVAFKNTIFPDWTLTTTPFMVKSEEDFGKPSAAVKMSTSILAKEQSFYVGIAGASPENPITFTVDFGNGKPVEFTATSATAPLQPNVSGKRAGTFTTIYIPEGADLTALRINDMRLNSLDVTAARALQTLQVNNCSLPSADLRWNSRLTFLDLSNNAISTVDLSEPNASYLKNFLSDINLSNNKISTMKLIDNYGLHKLNVANNQLTEINLVHAVKLTDLDISNNRIAEISLSDCEMLENLKMGGNLVSELAVPDYVPLKVLDITGNAFTLATLPAPGICPDYTYAPQAPIAIPTKAPSVNLSAQNVTVNGHSTVYTWYFAADNTPVAEGNIRADKGRFVFTNPSLGDIYCVMTNDAFPDLAGDNALRTTVVTTAEPPTNAFVSFGTATTGTMQLSMAGVENGVTIYIDWTGNGDLEQYVLRDTYTVFEANTFANADVRCYSYEDIDGVSVFSLSGARMKYMDASAMKSVKMFGLSGASVPEDKLKLPTVETLGELTLDGNGLTAISFETIPNLYRLSLNNNNLTSLDVSLLKNLQVLYVSDNKIKEISFNNPRLWELAMTGNGLEKIDLTGAPSMEQLWLSGNNISSINLEPATHLRIVTLDKNRFDLTTLPVPKDSYYYYGYTNQAPLHIETENGIVNLSSQAKVGNVATRYTWFLDTPFFDENGALAGEELYENEEYTLANGVTTFLKPFSNVMCVMTNGVFPSLYLYTDFIDVTAGVDAPTAESDVFEVSLAGGVITVRSSAADGTPVALIALDGRVMATATMAGGEASMPVGATGVAIVAVGNRAAKVVLR